MFDPDEFRQRYGSTELQNDMNLALRIFDNLKADDISEEAWAEHALKFVEEHSTTLVKCGVRCVSILICKRGQYPMYFTLRGTNGNWVEEQAIRNIEPVLAFQLDLSHLSNYKLTPVFVETKQIHMYRAVARENQLDNQFFIRALIRPSGRLRSSTNTKQYLISEMD